MPPKSDNKRRSRTPREEKEFEEYMLQLDRVTRVVKGGRRMRFRATVAIGDRAGRVGLGIGKGNDVQISVRKAVTAAKKNIINVPIVNDTIPHEIKIKYKAARMLVMPAAPGTGIIAGGALRKILELAGVKNVLSKNIGTSNKLVVGQGALKLLSGLRMTEAAKKFVAEMKKEKDAQKKKSAARRAESDKVGKRRTGNRSTEQDRSPKQESAKDQTKGDLKEAVKKVVQEKGRLEQEAEKKQPTKPEEKDEKK